MHGTKRILSILGLSWLLLTAATAKDAAAQSPDRGQRNGLARMDANGDGVLQPEEIPERAKPIIRRLAERAGIDPNGPVPLDRLARQPGQAENREERGRAEERNRDDRGRDGRNDRNNDRDAEQRRSDDDDDDRRRRDRDEEDRPERRPDALPAKVPGFGINLAFARVPGFDVPHSVTSQGGPTLAELEKQHDGRLIGYARRLLERSDENGNQIVDPAEWNRLRWRGDPNEIDLNRDGRLTLAEIIQRIAKERDEDDDDRNRNNERREVDNAAAAADSAPPDGGRNENDKVVEHARNLIRQYDRNNNGRIDADERERMRGDPAQADANGDGAITQEELVARLRGPQDATPPREEQSAEGDRRREARRAAARSRSERDADRGRERGPAWFRTRDKDGDGQVAMSEYASSWDDAKAAEFAGRDKNGDGVISLREASQ